MVNKISIVLIHLLMSLTIIGYSQSNSSFDIISLPATDALGRKLYGYSETGEKKKDKYVGLFYWTWHNHFADSTAYIASDFKKYLNDYYHPGWPTDASYYYWAEPLFGYYRSTDRWVIRRHAEMLGDADVDVIVFDCTNGSYTWEESYMTLCEVFSAARADGVRTPQIAFMLGFAPHDGSLSAIKQIYESLYAKGLYKDLWFKWKGKPLIMAYYEHLEIPTGDIKKDKLHQDIRNFFTFRPVQPVYNKGPERSDHWGWLEIYPQNGFVQDANGNFEQVTVGVAQNWSKATGLSAMNAPNTFGRSYTQKHEHQPNDKNVAYGLNFKEQWERAIELDPEFIFITGWNEWVAGRHQEWMGTKNAFPDQYDHEYSRDIEPMKGGHGDSYYYQMVNKIRKFKGSTPLKTTSKTPIQIDGCFTDWTVVLNRFDAHRGNTKHRDEHGWGKLHYTNTSGRNDIISAKATFDDDYIYFLVETEEPISSIEDVNWMNLLIDVDRNRHTGWEGYDFIINRMSPTKSKAILEKNVGGWKWQKVGEIDYALAERWLELRISKKQLLITKSVDLEFKWIDNVQQSGDIMDFYTEGDVAPIGRFNYYLIEEK